jgi:hypothetical protein
MTSVVPIGASRRKGLQPLRAACAPQTSASTPGPNTPTTPRRKNRNPNGPPPPKAEEIRPQLIATPASSSKAAPSTSTDSALSSPPKNACSAKSSNAIPTCHRKDYEKLFADYLGAPHTIWLGRGIFGDDTHGHVDDLTRFVAPDTVVTMVETNPKDVNHKPLRDNLRRLRAATRSGRQAAQHRRTPHARPVVFEQRRLPASYANFYIANGIVLVPVFNDPNDRIALNTLAALFPTREVVPIYSGDLIWGLGTMHCMTQQQPSALSCQRLSPE